MSASTSPSLQESVVSWQEYARQGDWKKAGASADFTRQPACLREALHQMIELQEAVRSRRYIGAQQAWRKLDERLSEMGREGLDAQLGVLEALIQPAQLPGALEALASQGSQVKKVTADPDQLRAQLEAALGHPLTRAEALNSLGVLEYLGERPEQARALFEEALALDAGAYRALSNLGNLDLDAGDLSAAEARYRAAIALNPEFDGAQHNLGVILRRQGKVTESVRQIKLAQSLSYKRTKKETGEEISQQLQDQPALNIARWVVPLFLVLFVLAAVYFGG